MAPSLPFPVVGIGASAGGLEALQDVFSGVRRDTPMAFFVIQHLSPDFKSMMLEILARHTPLSVTLPDDGTVVTPGTVYLIPPTHDLQLDGDRIRLTRRSSEGGLHHPIDLFLESLAAHQRGLAIAVILSGTGSDGTQGIRAVHNRGGTVLVQDPGSAKFDGMPRSAIGTGIVDLVLSSFSISEHLNEWPTTLDSSKHDGDAEPLRELFDLVARETRVDLSSYKEGTLLRRIHRRMQTAELADMRDYLDLVAKSSTELQALSSDLLIGVTSFFRDPEAWDVLTTKVLRDVVVRWRGDVRMWVAGCSTGPEAYSLAILAMEAMEAEGVTTPLRVFATDANPEAIKEAMAGTFDEGMIDSVPEPLRDKYFKRVGEVWQVRRFLRDSITFAVHNVITDPPFTRLGLVSCRNMLIYLRPDAQRPVLARLHFGLHEDGVLFLGASETVGDRKGYFEPIDLKWKIFRAKGSSGQLGSIFGRTMPYMQRVPGAAPRPVVPPKNHLMAAATHYIPPGVGVDANFDVEHFFGDVTPFIRLPEGRANLNLLNMLPPAVSVFVGSAARRARADEEPNVIPGVQLGSKLVSVRVMLAQGVGVEPSDRGLLVFFEEVAPVGEPDAVSMVDLSDASRERIAGLEDELMVTRENLRTAVEDLEATNEELQATNEELIASNEELQSTNEELQSVNEELFSVNTEYQEKIEELEYLTGDLENLLRSIDVGALFLDAELRVRRFNDTVLRLIPLQAQDIGRAFDDFTMRASYPTFRADLSQVQASGVDLVRDLVDHEGVEWRVRIRRFDGSHRRASGVIITFHDATTLRSHEELAANLLAAGLAGVGVIIVDLTTQQVRTSEVADRLLGVDPEGSSFGFEALQRLLDGELSSPPRDPHGPGIVQRGDALRRHRRADGTDVLLRTFAQRITHVQTRAEQLIVVLQEVK